VNQLGIKPKIILLGSYAIYDDTSICDWEILFELMLAPSGWSLLNPFNSHSCSEEGCPFYTLPGFIVSHRWLSPSCYHHTLQCKGACPHAAMPHTSDIIITITHVHTLPITSYIYIVQYRIVCYFHNLSMTTRWPMTSWSLLLVTTHQDMIDQSSCLRACLTRKSSN